MEAWYFTGQKAEANSQQHNGNNYGGVTYNHVYHGVPYRATEQVGKGELAKIARDSPAPAVELKPKNDPIHQELIRAAAEGYSPRKIRALISGGADVDAKDPRGLTPLHHATFNGRRQVVGELIAAEAGVNAYDPVFGTPLCLAAARKHEAIVAVLLGSEADLRTPGGYLGSAFHCACFSGSRRSFDALLQADSEALHRECTSCALMWRHLNSRPDHPLTVVSREFLARVQGLYTVFDRQLPIHRAAREGCLHLIEWILELGTPVDVTYASWRQVATDYPSLDSPDATDRRTGKTLFIAAAACLSTETIRCLTRNGALGTGCDSTGANAMYYLGASRAESGEAPVRNCIAALIDAGAEVEAQDETGLTPLMCAVAKDNTDVVKCLIRAGADKERCDKDSRTPLMYACQLGNVRSVELLCQAGVHLSTKDASGYSAMHYAARSSHPYAGTMAFQKYKKAS